MQTADFKLPMCRPPEGNWRCTTLWCYLSTHIGDMRDVPLTFKAGYNFILDNRLNTLQWKADNWQSYNGRQSPNFLKLLFQILNFSISLSLSIFVKCQMDRGKKSHEARPVVQPWRSCHPSRRQEGDVTRLELGHTQSGSRPLSALNLPFHISLHNLCRSVCQWTVRGA